MQKIEKRTSEGPGDDQERNEVIEELINAQDKRIGKRECLRFAIIILKVRSFFIFFYFYSYTQFMFTFCN
jgi:hypothetical protein